MLEVLEFIFSGFWIFVGTFILLSVVVDGIVNIFKVFCRNYVTDDLNKKKDKLDEDGMGD